MKPISCDHCEDGTNALYLLQDIGTGDSVAFCADHYAMQCMGVAEAWANEQMSKSGSEPKSGDTGGQGTEQSTDLIQSEATASDERANDSVPTGSTDTPSEHNPESAE